MKLQYLFCFFGKRKHKNPAKRRRCVLKDTTPTLFACGEWYCFAVIFGPGRVIFASQVWEANRISLQGSALKYHFCDSKNITLLRSNNHITKNYQEKRTYSRPNAMVLPDEYVLHIIEKDIFYGIINISKKFEKNLLTLPLTVMIYFACKIEIALFLYCKISMKGKRYVYDRWII